MASRFASLFAHKGALSVLALAGWGALVAGAFLALWGEHSGRDSAWIVLAPVLIGLACVSHLVAFTVDLWAARMHHRVPFVALHYVALIAGIGLWRLTAEWREAAWYRQNPQGMSVKVEDDALRVRTSAGIWHVPLIACTGSPAPGIEYDANGAGIATHEFNGTVEVLFGTTTRPYMRLQVPTRRIECLR